MSALVLLVTFALLFPRVNGQSCPTEWVDINGRCFLLVNKATLPTTFESRRQYCLQQRADLAKFDPWQDFQAFSSQILNEVAFSEYYIGLTDISTEGDFRWVTDNTLPTSFPQSFQTDGGVAENCVVISSGPFVWMDTSCDLPLPFICERPAEYPPCGTGPFADRIVGGRDSTLGAWPWQGIIQDANGFICGASLLSAEWAVTAAHCFGVDTLLVLGDVDPFFNISDASQVTRVTWFLHHRYRFNVEFDYDIALLYLHTPATFTNYVRPVCAYDTITSPDTDVSPPELTELENCHIIGWGLLSEGGQFPSTLQEAPVNILPPSSCANYGADFDQRIMLCAGVEDFSIDSCQGDSGGPLLCQPVGPDQRWHVAGVVSFGEGCATEGFPGVYTRMATTFPFVNNTRNLASSLLFKCPGSSGNGKVILTSQVCDFVVDCDDYYDERGCDPISPGNNIEVTSPKFRSVTNFINRRWIFFPPRDRTVRASFTLNTLDDSGSLTYVANISDATPLSVPTINTGGAAVTFSSSGTGEPFVISINKTTMNDVAGFQATISV